MIAERSLEERYLTELIERGGFLGELGVGIPLNICLKLNYLDY